jgi:putative aldouronate transport system permease protein
MILPLIIATFIFAYLPLAGWSMAFFDYKLGKSLLSVPFVGLKYFENMVGNPAMRDDIFRVLRNTFGMSFLGIAASILPPMFAIAITEIRNRPFSRIVQTITTIPNFLSWVLVYSLAFSMFAVNGGVLNTVLMSLGLIKEPTNLLASPNNVWIAQTLYGIWKSLGWSAIIYIAAITGIDSELYEAAAVDGADRMQKIIHITVPSLIPTFSVMLLMGVASMLSSDFEKIYVFNNALNKDTIETLDLFVYNRGLIGRNIPYSTAVGMLKSLVSLVLLFTANGLSKLLRGDSIF